MSDTTTETCNTFQFACVDVGTNSIKILIANLADGKAEPVFEMSTTTRLGENMNAGHHLLLELPMRRTLEGLSTLLQAASNFHVQSTTCVGTAALRDASNAEEFVKRVKETLGLEIDVISGEEEARLSFLAVRRDPNWRAHRRIRVMDVGGGSTEIIVGGSDSIPIEARYSVNLGAVKLTERYLKSDPPTVAQLTAANAALSAEFERIILPPVPATSANPPLIGVGGTVTTLAAICIGGVKDPVKIHGYMLSAEELDLQVSRLRTMTVADRQLIPGLDPRRADIILAGAMLVSAGLARVGATHLEVSTRGLRWGVLYDRYGAVNSSILDHGAQPVRGA